MISFEQHELEELATNIDIVAEWLDIFDTTSPEYGIQRRDAMLNLLRSVYQKIDSKLTP